MADAAGEIRLDDNTRNQLVEIVKKFPLLYATHLNRSIEARDERKRLWDKVGEQLGIPGDICKVKFVTLKSNYFKNLKENNVSLEHQRRMSFLDDYTPVTRQETPGRITQRRLSKRIRVDYCEDNDNDDSNNNTSKIASRRQSVYNANGMNGVPKSAPFGQQNSNNDDDARIASNNSDQTETKTPVQQVTDVKTNSTADLDELSTFYKQMEQTTRKFSPLLQVKVKRMISDIMYDAEEKWISEQA